ncbi:enoyl-ACP reductase FabI [Thiococcus pfennigii]|jgi:enoyl-[acyl-carrier protein] reductase I|uniref:enoyl-ACP reductase FabI n=1 Tax=Thiococcus pfennigii TaxID=1057 RepID=UPI001903A8EB|nr:enoyl-ACP reductase [Thiococcus pfennigii]MBK1699873.1 enoyl-[acyl-carrier-protein] reductase [Thiococcus pfennigii]MBK1732527.1 enoyl-[acyl-carrier-protein] reductase [Thiococcus pfennigii]
MGFLQNKRILVTGVASNRSIAWGCAAAMRREGAEIALTYQNDKLKGRVEDFAAQLGCDIVLPLDVSTDWQIAHLFGTLGEHWDGLDAIVHSIAYAPRHELEGDYVEALTRDGFTAAHEVSSYSFGALAKAARPMMEGRNGALLTLSFIGSVRAVPYYNVMGLAKASLEANVRYLAASLGPQGTRVNAISAGPIHTLAASGISHFRSMLKQVEKHAPLRRTVTAEEVGNAAAFLCSDLASGVTGDVLYVDTGFHILGLG